MNQSGVWLHFAPDHPALAGHFPQQPIVPGVLLLDEALHAVEQAAAQATSALAGSHWYIAQVKFHRLVQPGESLRLDCVEQPPGAGVLRALRIELHAQQALTMSASIERRA
jgi:3-hydroxymyristoyl/3-hydroxydecanoyl-(acyl carrier protein) dehydratase